MPAVLSAHAPDVLRHYYRVLGGGLEAYQDGGALRPLLSAHLEFTGPLAGHRPDSTEAFLRGAAGFVGTVQTIDVIQDVHDDGASAVLYAATLPGGTMTFAEFVTVADGLITSVHLHYDGQEYLAKGGR